MSAIDNAFIRAFTTDVAGSGASQAERKAKLAPTGKASIAPISSAGAQGGEGRRTAANNANRPHWKSSALSSSVQHTIIPAPHFNLSSFAHTATTLDSPPPVTTPVRIDPPAVARLAPHSAGKPAAASHRDQELIREPNKSAVARPHSRATSSQPTGPVPYGESDRDGEEEIIALPFTSAPSSLNPSPSPLVPRPAFEVDRLVWPETCDALIERIGPEVDELAQELMAESALGRKVIAVSGDSRDAGATTLTLVLSRRLAKSGATVALVDADFAAPRLAGRLGLVIGIGWETVLALPDKTSLWDTMVESIEDRLTVVPLASRSRLTVAGEISGRLADCLGQLRDAFDLVLVDAGPLLAADPQSSWLTSPGNGLDAAILVCDVRTAEAERLTIAGRRLLDANIAALGVAENYCA